MLVFYVGVECRVAEVFFAADTGVVALHGVVTGSALSADLWVVVFLTLKVCLL